MTTSVCYVCHLIWWVLVKMDWPRGHAHYVSKWTEADRLPVPADRSPVPAAGRPATRRPVQVDPAAAPAAGWVPSPVRVGWRPGRRPPAAG